MLRWKTSLPTRRRRAVTEPTNSLVHLLVTCKLILTSSPKWDSFLTPEGSEEVSTDLCILHDMIAPLQENKIRKREVSISTYTC